MKTSGAWLLCSIAWFLSACGTAASYDYDLPPIQVTDSLPLATMRGQIVGMTDARSDRVRVALIWLPVLAAEGKFQISQNVTSRPGLLDVEIDISQQPPEGAIEWGMDPTMRYGQAEVVVYEDRNVNGTFDVLPLGRTSPDRVLGRALGVRLWWLGAGMPAPPDARGYQPVAQGFSLTYGPISIDPEPGDCAPDPQSPQYHTRCNRIAKEKATDVSPQEAIKIVLSDEPALQSYGCLGFWGTSSEKSDEWPDDSPGWKAPALRKQICNESTCDCKDKVCPLDLPVAGKTITSPIRCNEAKTKYVWKDCVRDPKLCGTLFCHYGHGERDPNEPEPEDWPVCP